MAAFSDQMRANDRALKQFLFERMYRHSTVNRMTAKARRVVGELFTFYLAAGLPSGRVAGNGVPTTTKPIARD